MPGLESASGAGRNMRQFQSELTPPHNHGVAIRLRRVLVKEDLWVVEGVYAYDGWRGRCSPWS